MSGTEQCLIDSLAKIPRNQLDKPRSHQAYIMSLPHRQPFTLRDAPDPFSPPELVLVESLPSNDPLGEAASKKTKRQTDAGGERGRLGLWTRCPDLPGAAPCSKGKTYPPALSDLARLLTLPFRSRPDREALSPLWPSSSPSPHSHSSYKRKMASPSCSCCIDNLPRNAKR